MHGQDQSQTTGVNVAPQIAEDDSLLNLLEQQATQSRDAAAYHARELERHQRIVRAAERAMVELRDVGDVEPLPGQDEAKTMGEQVLRAGQHGATHLR